jgi:hypothetical protein
MKTSFFTPGIHELQEVLAQLERWYNVKFILADDIRVYDSLTVNIENKPLEDILELIGTITGLNYRHEGDTVFLSSGSNTGQLDINFIKGKR